ncbi:polysaccharide deacetylase family protein [Pedobacter cryoconitis]|uniref:Peptidoglycan/xylan/chitin deacetylase (PgdA/CDA1 family) n=1 Tax=Pedobacter cryoconitis TaxID=188932 RepID=A0A7X0J2N3_9SPHI|nr:polysaccharide deacetylase family protein [Pedobacter cryoconitis]MBB6499971.1 peptidoglycan/xylan/chitin deacetylase (PgdA/CDA1 family) [Pedobacter cryoconitis]
MKPYNKSLSLFLIPLLFSCHQTAKKEEVKAARDTVSVAESSKEISNSSPADAKTIMERPEIPVLCYHQIRDWKASDSKRAHDDIIPPANFRAHMKMLADSGYHTILPDQLHAYLTYGAKLPAKPIMITFDDTDLDQYTVGAAELKKYGFKGVFFIMTVSIGRPRYMSKAQIKELSDEGNVIASHTWNHKNFAQFTEEDWKIQIDEPTRTLEKLTGKKVEYFAYPYGVFKASSLSRLKEHGFKAAFILSTPRDEVNPIYTIRRIIDPGHYTAKNLYNSLQKSFNKKKVKAFSAKEVSSSRL